MDYFLQENTFYFMMAIGILFMLTFALAFVVYVNVSQKKILHGQMEKQKLAMQYQEELLHSNILTQEEERIRIARDLHDDIGSKLNVIFLNMHRLKEAKGEQKKIEEITDEVESVINLTIESTRRISHDLLPPTLEDFGIAEAIRELQYHFQQLKKITIDFNYLNNRALPRDKMEEVNLFRVVQELINNSIRHGGADEIRIKLQMDKTSTLDYQDNGCGFDSDQLSQRKGLGMKNIESRLQMIQAQHTLQTAIGKGLFMQIEWPAPIATK